MQTRVLIVDDNPGDRRLIRRLLETSSFGSFETLEAPSGADAIERATTEDIDCILLDYSMPGLDGLETLRELKRRQIETPAIFLTEYGGEHLVTEALRTGAAHFMFKSSATDATLATSIASAIYRRRDGAN